MKQSKEDLINKVETLIGYLEYENKSKLDKSFYRELSEEVKEWLEELKNNEVDLTN